MAWVMVKITDINLARINLDKITELRESFAASWLQDFRLWEQRSELKGLTELMELS